MYRAFDYINLLLLLALGGTCIYQWSRERDYGAQVVSLRSLAEKQESRLASQGEDLKQAREDIDGFKASITALSAQADDLGTALRAEKGRVLELSSEKEKLARQRESWQAAVEQHKAAIASRDEAIQTLVKQREEIVLAQRSAAEKANSAINAYNELARKYDEVVGKYNQLATQYQSERAAAASANP